MRGAVDAGEKAIGGYCAVKERIKLLTNDDSVELTVTDVLVEPVELPLAVPSSGRLHAAPESDAAEQISASDLGIILTS